MRSGKFFAALRKRSWGLYLKSARGRAWSWFRSTLSFCKFGKILRSRRSCQVSRWLSARLRIRTSFTLTLISVPFSKWAGKKLRPRVKSENRVMFIPLQLYSVWFRFSSTSQISFLLKAKLLWIPSEIKIDVLNSTIRQRLFCCGAMLEKCCPGLKAVFSVRQSTKAPSILGVKPSAYGRIRDSFEQTDSLYAWKADHAVPNGFLFEIKIYVQCRPSLKRSSR